MSIGHPDFGQGASVALMAPVADLGELAVRIGAPQTLDRAGNVYFQTDFSDGAGEIDTPVLTGTQKANARTDGPYQGDAYLYVETSASGGDSVTLTKYVPRITTQRAAVSVTFRSKIGVPRLLIALTLNIGGTFYSGNLAADFQGNTFTYYDNASNPHTLANLTPPVGLHGFYWHAKLVMDCTTGRYVRASLNGTNFLLTGILPPTFFDTDIATLYATLKVNNQTGAAAGMGLDNLVITVNEP